MQWTLTTETNIASLCIYNYERCSDRYFKIIIAFLKNILISFLVLDNSLYFCVWIIRLFDNCHCQINSFVTYINKAAYAVPTEMEHTIQIYCRRWAKREYNANHCEIRQTWMSVFQVQPLFPVYPDIMKDISTLIYRVLGSSRWHCTIATKGIYSPLYIDMQ